MPLPHFLNTCGKPCWLESIFHRTFFLSTSWLLHSQFLASVEGTAWLTMLMTSFFIFLIDPVTLHWAYCLKRKFLILNVTPSPTRQLSPKHEILMSTLRNHLEGSGFHIQTKTCEEINHIIITVHKFQWSDWSIAVQLDNTLILIRCKWKTEFEIQRNFSFTLHWYHFSRFVLGLCFLTSKKEDNAVKLRQYNGLVQERCF